MFEPQLAALAGHGRFIVPDLRGFGGSGLVPGPSEMVRHGRRRACAPGPPGDRRGGGRGRVDGWLRRARPAPERPLARASAGAGRHPDLVRRRGGARGSRRPPARSTRRARRRSCPSSTWLLGPSASAELRARVAGGLGLGSPGGQAAALRGMALRPDARDILARFGGPVLVVVGADDVLTPPAKARAMADLVPGAELVEIPGAGHLANLEQPEAFNAALGRLLARGAAAARELERRSPCPPSGSPGLSRMPFARTRYGAARLRHAGGHRPAAPGWTAGGGAGARGSRCGTAGGHAGLLHPAPVPAPGADGCLAVQDGMVAGGWTGPSWSSRAARATPRASRSRCSSCLPRTRPSSTSWRRRRSRVPRCSSRCATAASSRSRWRNGAADWYRAHAAPRGCLGFLPVLAEDACGAGHPDAADRSVASLRFAGDTLITTPALPVSPRTLPGASPGRPVSRGPDAPTTRRDLTLSESRPQCRGPWRQRPEASAGPAGAGLAEVGHWIASDASGRALPGGLRHSDAAAAVPGSARKSFTSLARVSAGPPTGVHRPGRGTVNRGRGNFEAKTS